MELNLERVCVRIEGRPILSDVVLSVPEGSFVGLVGPNGSGKSTLLRTVYRSLKPSSGVVRVGPDDVWQMSARVAAQRTAAVLQDASATVGLTVAEVVALGRTPHLGLFDRESAVDGDVVTESMDRTGVLAFADRAFSTLSGGERQRVLLARALAQQPRLLVLDEPTNHLDVRARFELLDLIGELGTTTFAVLHDLDLAVRSCDQLVVLDAGAIAAAGPVLAALTPVVLREVFGVAASVERHADGVVRITYEAKPLAD
ncbi:ABC transporter ATP-binding protein [Kutzneria viridogrisea]|uniref:ABC transporter domain-containing protein n=2 Tax=Kutzneria TaxID=43356 RepID=W5WJX7_9PSEU|nr:ABC transporter ATP-binding protein [Kutzneria albida]AHI01051.1 hypothetical protein KALB_7693 [Kutzneria albida DSM 43870]MBA8926306.1 iron complex transport system ATP-binding protein [Kutzneria viridogrisea]